MMKLNELKKDRATLQKRKRVGRGIASGTGKTCGSGQKGQKSRSGVSLLGFEGGQNPLYRRVPKRGFVNKFRKAVQEVSLAGIQSQIDAGKIEKGQLIDLSVLKAAGLIRNLQDEVKILGSEGLKAAVKISVHRASKGALAAVKAVKGEISLIREEVVSA